MTTNKQKEDALNAYIGKVSNIQEMIQRLTKAADDHFDTHPDDIHWGHVGNVSGIEEQLKRICDQVFKEGEHAP